MGGFCLAADARYARSPEEISGRKAQWAVAAPHSETYSLPVYFVSKKWNHLVSTDAFPTTFTIRCRIFTIKSNGVDKTKI